MRHLLALGLGYSAAHLASALASKGWTVAGTSRSEEGATKLARRGWTGIHFPGDAPSRMLADEIGRATHILVSIPPAAAGDPAMLHHARHIAASRGLRWIGYMSTVGVYGDHGGAWVDETTPVTPLSERSRWRVEAETAWLGLGKRSGQRVNIFRLPGIYGPGRSAFEALRAGTSRRIVKPGQVFNRIHVHDIARTIEAAILADTHHDLYNVTDDEPAPFDEVVTYAAALLGVEPPAAVLFDKAGLSPMAASFYRESKRVSNKRMKDDLGMILQFPTYREGLSAILAEERGA